MCGISGVYKFGGYNSETDLGAMNNAIVHRGPDSDGLWFDKDIGIGFAHRRLAVVDLSAAGHQPMVSISGRYVLCYNGEIYNHLTIRQELESKFGSIAWRGHSDTETLLVAIEHLGLEQALCLLVGMFAFALWDNENRTLQLARDRIGEKPLYYGWMQNRFVFASELKAIEALPGAKLEIDPDALSLYFRHLYVPAPYCIYSGIYKLEPGSFLTLHASSSEPEKSSYWSAIDVAMAQRNNTFQGSFDEASIQLEALLNQSIDGQLMADVPVGAFLSGGIDSSTVVALMQNCRNSKVNTFTIGFDNEAYNEAEYAKKIANHLGTNHTELYLTDSEIAGSITDLPDITDEPFADSSLIPTFAVAGLARSAVTVCLSGDGGDELLGGYNRYPPAATAIKLRHRTGATGKWLANTMMNSPLFKTGLSGSPEWRFSAMAKSSKLNKLCLATSMLAPDSDPLAYRELLSYWRKNYNPMLEQRDPDSFFHSGEFWLNHSEPQESAQMLDLLTYLPDDILVKVDRAAMAHSLETRVPMLDHRLIEFIWSLPIEFRAQTKKTTKAPKPLLKSIAARHVPLELIERPKRGFSVPVNAWLQGPLRSWAEDLLDTRTLEQQGLLNTTFVQDYWKAISRNQNVSSGLIWSILMLQHWLRARR